MCFVISRMRPSLVEAQNTEVERFPTNSGPSVLQGCGTSILDFINHCVLHFNHCQRSKASFCSVWKPNLLTIFRTFMVTLAIYQPVRVNYSPRPPFDHFFAHGKLFIISLSQAHHHVANVAFGLVSVFVCIWGTRYDQMTLSDRALVPLGQFAVHRLHIEEMERE